MHLPLILIAAAVLSTIPIAMSEGRKRARDEFHVERYNRD
jgi:hypothetical protein